MRFSNVGGAKAKNHSFQCGFQMWEEPRPKTAVFSQKPWCSAWFSNVGGAKAKSTVLGQKPQFSVRFSNVGGAKAKNCNFQPKTAVFNTKNSGFQKWEEPSQKPWVFAKNCGFQCGFQLWEEPSQKLQFLAENCSFQCGFQLWEEPRSKTAKNHSFQPKTAVFSVVFNCGRSQGLKLPKTGFQFGFQPKTVDLTLKSMVFIKNHGFQPKTMFFADSV